MMLYPAKRKHSRRPPTESYKVETRVPKRTSTESPMRTLSWYTSICSTEIHLGNVRDGKLIRRHVPKKASTECCSRETRPPPIVARRGGPSMGCAKDGRGKRGRACDVAPVEAEWDHSISLYSKVDTWMRKMPADVPNTRSERKTRHDHSAEHDATINQAAPTPTRTETPQTAPLERTPRFPIPEIITPPSSVSDNPEASPMTAIGIGLGTLATRPSTANQDCPTRQEPTPPKTPETPPPRHSPTSAKAPKHDPTPPDEPSPGEPARTLTRSPRKVRFADEVPEIITSPKNDAQKPGPVTPPQGTTKALKSSLKTKDGKGKVRREAFSVPGDFEEVGGDEEGVEPA